MKKLLFVLVLAPLALFADAGLSGLRVATVDLLVLLRNHPDYDRNDSFLENKGEDVKKKVDAIKAEGEKLQAEGKKLMEQFRNPMLSEKAKAETEKKLQDIQQQLIQIEQRYRQEAMRGNQDLQEDRARLMKVTTNDLRARLRKYAEEKGYDLILDTNVVAYSKDSLDVTDQVLVQMGVDPLKAKGRGKNEGK